MAFSMACFDTEFLIELLKGNPAAEKKTFELINSGESTTITPLIAVELYRGIVQQTNPIASKKLEELLDTLDILEFDKLACKKAAELIERQKKLGKPVGDFDTLTAAIAIRHNEKIVSKNTKHFEQFNELKVEKW